AAEEVELSFGLLASVVAGVGGVLQTQADVSRQHRSASSRSLQVVMSIPIDPPPLGAALRIVCRRSLLQSAFTQLAISAGLTVCSRSDRAIPLLTDDALQIPSADRIIWVQQDSQAPPQGIQACINLSISPDQLRQVVEAVNRDENWGIDRVTEAQLSEREQAILTLLTQGCRDREIADRLIISESTVKFHMNNVLAKLKARTRYQAIHLAIVNGWIH
ncbi:MAG: response regulator transcription factor, partial [Microcoleus sp. SIO2G3]|nr:response regulator transcription factor [Microcoleus sp. SIO2G3]